MSETNALRVFGFEWADARVGLLRGLLLFPTGYGICALLAWRVPQAEEFGALAVVTLGVFAIALLEGRGSRRFSGREAGSELGWIFVIGALIPVLVSLQFTYTRALTATGDLNFALNELWDNGLSAFGSPGAVALFAACFGSVFALVSAPRLAGMHAPSRSAVRKAAIFALPLIVVCALYLFAVVTVALLAGVYALVDAGERVVVGLRARRGAELRARFEQGLVRRQDLLLLAHLEHQPALNALRVREPRTLAVLPWLRAFVEFELEAVQRAALALGELALAFHLEENPDERSAARDLAHAAGAIEGDLAGREAAMEALLGRECWAFRKDQPAPARAVHCALTAVLAEGPWAGSEAARNVEEAARALMTRMPAEALREAVRRALLPWCLERLESRSPEEVASTDVVLAEDGLIAKDGTVAAGGLAAGDAEAEPETADPPQA